jgi:hypothetical protein
MCIGAQDPPLALSPTIVSVVSSGYWERSADHGSYRLIVENVGFEHVMSRVLAQWVAEPNDSSKKATVALQKELIPPLLFSFGAPTLTATKTGVRAALSGASPTSPIRRCHAPLICSQMVVSKRFNHAASSRA